MPWGGGRLELGALRLRSTLVEQPMPGGGSSCLPTVPAHLIGRRLARGRSLDANTCPPMLHSVWPVSPFAGAFSSALWSPLLPTCFLCMLASLLTHVPCLLPPFVEYFPVCTAFCGLSLRDPAVQGIVE